MSHVANDLKVKEEGKMRKLFILIAAMIIAPGCGVAQVTQQVYEDFVRPNDLFRPDGRVFYIPPHTR